MSPFKIYLHYVEIHHSLSHPNVCQLGSPICIISICSRVYHIPNLSYADLNHPDPFICHMTWLFHKVIFIYADLDYQGPKCDHQDPLCDHSSYADLNHPDSFIFVRLDAHPYTYLCLKLKFIYADLNHQLSILTLTWLIHTSITFLR